MDSVISTLDNIANGIKPLSVPLAGLILVVIGLLWTFAKDPQKKEMYIGWIINVAIGFGIVYLAASLVTWFSGNVTGF